MLLLYRLFPLFEGGAAIAAGGFAFKFSIEEILIVEGLKMIALRQLKRVPKNHKIVIEVPASIHENQMMEVILLFKETPKNSRADKLAQLKASQHDGLFLSDLQMISDDFADVDGEKW